MLLLLAGLGLFLGIHLLLVGAPQAVGAFKTRNGPNAVKGIVTLASAGGITLIVVGWRVTETQWLYLTPPGLRHGAMLLIALAIYLFVVSARPSLLKRYLRHPQLTGVFLWAVAHMLANGDSRSLILFGAMAIWSLAEIALINKRDGTWIKPEAPPLATDLLTAVIAMIAVVALAWAHPWFTGMPVIPGSL